MTGNSEAYFDLRAVAKKLWAKKYFFVAGVLLALLIGWVYLQLVTPVYQVRTTLQLQNHGLNKKEANAEKFINGLELLDNGDELEDEIGILSSFSIVRNALQRLDYTVSYFQYPEGLGKFGAFFADEIRDDSLKVLLAANTPQLLNAPVYISFPTDSTYRVEVSEDNLLLYDSKAQEVVKNRTEAVRIDREVPLHQPFTSQYLHFVLTVGSNFPRDRGYYFTIKSLDKLTDQYVKKLRIRPISDESNIVEVLSAGPVIQKEEQFLNTLCQVYIENDVEKKNQLGVKTIAFIDRQLANVTDSLRKAENNLESFRAKNGIIEIGTTSKNLTEQVDALEKEKAGLTVQNEYLKFLSLHLQESSSLGNIAIPSTAGVNDPVLSSLIIELSDLHRDRIRLAHGSSEKNPVLQVLDKQIETTKTSLIENIDNQINSTDIALREVNRRLQQSQRVVNRLPENERSLIDIQRKFTFSDNIYNYLLEKKAEAGIAISSNAADKMVVDAARLTQEKPVSPNPLMVYAIALLLGLLLPVGFVIAQDFWKDTIKERKDLEVLTDIPLIGSVGNGPKKTSLVVEDHPYSAVAESFRFTRINLQYYYKHQPNQVIGMTSSVDGEGKTYCSANLAVEFANAGKKTLLIGGDLKKPKLQDYFTLKKTGLVNYVLENIPASQLIQKTSHAHLDILDSGAAVKNSVDFLEDPKIKKLFQEIKSSYDQIIVDTPPIHFVVDYFILQEFIDITVLVVRQDYTGREMMERSIEMLRNKNISNLTLLFNSVKDSSKYSSYHSHQHGHYINKAAYSFSKMKDALRKN